MDKKIVYLSSKYETALNQFCLGASNMGELYPKLYNEQNTKNLDKESYWDEYHRRRIFLFRKI